MEQSARVKLAALSDKKNAGASGQQQATAGSSSAGASKGAKLVLPHELIARCVGMKVLVVLTSDEELVGTLRHFDDDSNLLLDDAVHYATTVVAPKQHDSMTEEEVQAARPKMEAAVVHRPGRVLVAGKRIAAIVPGGGPNASTGPN